ncbi:MAG: hypothetical protein IT463_13900 [Planctomycetes bacterium]|nr:hypothetical protein [Planctomycetota bacterium]
MSRFRRLVLEADQTLMLLEPGLDAETLAQADGTLVALESRFAAYSGPMVAGTLTNAERAQLETDAKAAFVAPDVAAAAYVRDTQPRVSLWLRGGAKLPKAEKAGAGLQIPLGRRLQETVTAAVATSWLEALEAEFGNANFDSDRPLDVVVFPDPPAYLDFSQKRLRLNVPAWSSGFYSPGWEVICLPLRPDVCTAEVVRHEMFHALQDRLAPASLLVPWFAEGTAEWLDKSPPENGHLVTLDGFRALAWGYLATLVDRGMKLDLPGLLALDLAGFYANPELNYLLAYVFVDFVRGEEDLRPVYFEFWNLMRGGTDPQSAFARTFGVLDMEDLTRRMLDRMRRSPRSLEPPRFSHDVPEQFFERAPAKLGGAPTPAAREDVIAGGWFDVLGKLEKAGFDTGRLSFLKGDFDVLVVAIDHSESMELRLDAETFDFEAFSRWLFAVRFAGTLTINRTAPSGPRNEEVPPEVLITLVDSVLTGRVKAFEEASGIVVSDKLQKDIAGNYDRFEWKPAMLQKMRKREICLQTAQSIAWYWGVRQDKARVAVVDFHAEALSKQGELNFARTSFTPLERLFKETEQANKNRPGMAGADTDWWKALRGVLGAASELQARRVACLFFTDGPNSTGQYGHLESGRRDDLYQRDQEQMAQAFAGDWSSAGLGREDQPSVLQFVALPGAEAQGLEHFTAACPQARLDAWAQHFAKK